MNTLTVNSYDVPSLQRLSFNVGPTSPFLTLGAYFFHSAAAYDFVIVGGGLAGLVIASRLTEDANTTVLVIESGDTGDDVRSRIDIPSEAYFNGLLYGKYDWQYYTEPQPELQNRNISWPRGKGIGGSSAVNGMYLVRPSALEVDTWSQMQNNQAGATAWSWDSLFEAMKKVGYFARHFRLSHAD